MNAEITATDPTTTVPEKTPADPFFTLSPFGTVKVTEGNRVKVPARLAGWFTASAWKLADQPNRATIGPNEVADAKAGNLLRKQLRQWAADKDMSITFKGLVKTEDASGNPVNTSKEILTDENDVPFNDGTHVTFRVALRKDKATAEAAKPNGLKGWLISELHKLGLSDLANDFDEGHADPFTALSPFRDDTKVNGFDVEVPARLAAWFAASVTFLKNKPKGASIGPNVPENGAADLFRQQARKWARDNGMGVAFKGLIGEDDSADKEILTDENDIPFNDSTHVTFRWTKATATPAGNADANPASVTVTA